MGRIGKVFVLAAFLGLLIPIVGVSQEGPRDPFLYGAASFVIPGLGQYLNGETDKALVHFLVAVSIPTVGYYAAYLTLNPFLFYVVPLAQLGWSLYSAMDAYNVAQRYNELHGFSLLELNMELNIPLGG